MKRAKASLVSYSSSEDELLHNDTSGEAVTLPPAAKKRKLPQISDTIVTPVPVDDPKLHQGRIRATPHVDGQFAAYVYVSLAPSRRSLLCKILQDILSDAKAIVPTLSEVWAGNDDSDRPELHISLSRPIFLRAHQREDFKRAVKNMAKTQRSFTASFVMLSELVNDEKTRTFLTMEVGAGYHELSSLANALTPAVRAIRQQEYYSNPKFHASIAWALLDRPHNNPESVSETSDSLADNVPSSDDHSTLHTNRRATHNQCDFPTIPHFPPDMMVSLNEKYSARLSSPKVGSFDVEAITVKIGKDTSSWTLSS